MRDEGPLFLHSMWRTGSSFLLSRFEAQRRYLTFYEPFNGELGSNHLRRLAKRNFSERHVALGHPALGGSYFETFDLPDPATGRPLWTLASPRLPIHDVYNGLSAEGVRLIEACSRAAAVRGRTPVFGFCHSGTQIADMQRRVRGAHLYLSRPPRDQFVSYGPRTNDFFIAATAMQLLCSARLRGPAVSLVPQLARYDGIAVRAIARRAPHRLTMRLARMIWRRLTLADMYLIFYLSWVAANEAGRSCETLLSLQQLQADSVARTAIEARFAIDLGELDYRAPDTGSLGLDFAGLEQQVHAALGVDDRNPVAARSARPAIRAAARGA